MSHYLETPDGRRPFIRSREVLQVATEFVEWWPLEEQFEAALMVQRYLGLNEIEVEDVRRRARLFSINCDIDRSEASFGRRIDVIEAAQDIAVFGPERAHLFAPSILYRYRMWQDPDAIERVLDVVVFLWEHPPQWLEARRARLLAGFGGKLAVTPS